MSLKEILNKLLETEHAGIIKEVNDAVNLIIKKKETVKDNEIISLKAQMEILTETTRLASLKDIAKELVGNDEKKINLLTKLTDLKGLEDEKKIKESFKKTIKEYDNIFIVDANSGEIDPQKKIDESITTNTLKTIDPPKEVKNEVISNVLMEDK